MNTPVLISPVSIARLSPLRMPSRPADRDVTAVGDAICDNVHALGCTFVGERRDGCSDSGYDCFTIGRDRVDGLVCGETVRGAHRKG